MADWDEPSEIDTETWQARQWRLHAERSDAKIKRLEEENQRLRCVIERAKVAADSNPFQVWELRQAVKRVLDDA